MATPKADPQMGLAGGPAGDATQYFPLGSRTNSPFNGEFANLSMVNFHFIYQSSFPPKWTRRLAAFHAHPHQFSSAKGAISYQPGPPAQEISSQFSQGLKARITATASYPSPAPSVPNESLTCSSTPAHPPPFFDSNAFPIKSTSTSLGFQE